MFGYHDSNRCAFDLWSPVTSNSTSKYADPHQPGYGVWEDTPYHTAIENRAFSPYAKHSQELEDIIDEIAHGNFEITLDDDFSDSDLDYIEEQLMDRYGIDAELSIG